MTTSSRLLLGTLALGLVTTIAAGGPAGAAPALALCVHRDRDGACDRDRDTWPR